MFFYLSKLLSFAVSPLNWIIVLVVIAVITKRAGLKKYTLIAAGIMLLLFTNSFFLRKVQRTWEVDPVSTTLLRKNYEYGILLAAPVQYQPEKGIIELSSVSNRLLATIDLYERNMIRRIIISGGRSSLIGDQRAEAMVLADYLRSIGIPSRHLILDTLSRNTHESAVHVKQLLDSTDRRYSCLLITSAVHMKRAWSCFYQERLETDRYPVGHIAAEGIKFYHFFIPDHHNLFYWDAMMHEVISFYVYSLMGYV
jgi:uncharacterized SAM-binding protein YcdF (DUF218 family)